MGVLHLQNKDMLPWLVDKCTEYLRPILNPSQVQFLKPPAQLLAERDLIAAYSVKVIDLNALKSDRFAPTVRFLLEELIERGILQIEEIDQFKAVIEWATK